MRDQLEHAHSESAFEMLEQFYIGDYESYQNPSDNIAVHHTKQTIDTNDKSEKFVDVTKPMLSQIWNGGYTKEFYLKQVHIPRHTKDSAPIFGSPYLEVFTKTAWYVIPVVWLPFMSYITYLSSEVLGPLEIVICFVLGLVNWSLLEYFIHRFVFHVDSLLPDNSIALTAHFLLHGIHHFLPMDGLRLVMPPALAVVLAYPIFMMYTAFIPHHYGLAVAGGTFMGYILYDLTHYYLHHGKPFGEHLKEMKTYHLDHHYKESNLGFGITSKIWDKVFGTVLF